MNGYLKKRHAFGVCVCGFDVSMRWTMAPFFCQLCVYKYTLNYSLVFFSCSVSHAKQAEKTKLNNVLRCECESKKSEQKRTSHTRHSTVYVVRCIYLVLVVKRKCYTTKTQQVSNNLIYVEHIYTKTQRKHTHARAWDSLFLLVCTCVCDFGENWLISHMLVHSIVHIFTTVSLKVLP